MIMSQCLPYAGFFSPIWSFLHYPIPHAIPVWVLEVWYVKDRIWIEFDILVSNSERWNYGFQLPCSSVWNEHILLTQYIPIVARIVYVKIKKKLKTNKNRHNPGTHKNIKIANTLLMSVEHCVLRLLKASSNGKIPHTGDTESLDRC